MSDPASHEGKLEGYGFAVELIPSNEMRAVL